VRSIERLLGSPLERRRLEDFDYQAPAPKQDREFARPPRPANRSRRPAGAAKTRQAWPQRKASASFTANRRSNTRRRSTAAA
jgi:ATP-dependent RNA helicase RhlE